MYTCAHILYAYTYFIYVFMSLKIGWSAVWVSPKLFIVADPLWGGACGAESQGPHPTVSYSVHSDNRA